MDEPATALPAGGFGCFLPGGIPSFVACMRLERGAACSGFPLGRKVSGEAVKKYCTDVYRREKGESKIIAARWFITQCRGAERLSWARWPEAGANATSPAIIFPCRRRPFLSQQNNRWLLSFTSLRP
jgi:hypothetical protein